jgi:hypothetical protein
MKQAVKGHTPAEAFTGVPISFQELIRSIGCARQPDRI